MSVTGCGGGGELLAGAIVTPRGCSGWAEHGVDQAPRGP